MEMTSVYKTLLKTLGVSAAIVALATFGYVAQAQAPKKDEPKAAKKATPPACKTIKAQAGCEARTDCTWVGESKDKDGKVKAKAYCRAKPKEPAKKPEPKK